MSGQGQGYGGNLLESTLRNAPRAMGYRVYQPVNLMLWSDTNGDPILNAGTIHKKIITNLGAVIELRATFTTTDFIKLQTSLPSNFKPYINSRNIPYLRLRLKVRKLDLSGSATANDDTTLIPTLSFHGVGSTSVTSVAATAQVAAAADVADAAEEGAAWLEFDLVANMTTAQQQLLLARNSITIALSTSEAVGTNLAIEISACELVMDVHQNPTATNQ